MTLMYELDEIFWRYTCVPKTIFPGQGLDIPTHRQLYSGVTRGAWGRTALGDTLQGLTPERKNFLWVNLQRIVDKRGRAHEKGAG